MGLTSFTNAVGTSTKSTNFTGKRTYRQGTSLSSPVVTVPQYSRTVTTDKHSKMSPTPSDGSRATIWSRQVHKVVSNDPWILKQFRYQQNTAQASVYVEQDQIVEQHITNYYTPFTTNPLQRPGVLDNVLNESIAEALNGFSEDKMQAAVSAMEMNKTADLLAGSASKLAKALRSAKRGDWGSIPRHLEMDPRKVLSGKFAANRWLEYQYGWRPLVSDIHNGVVQVTKRIGNKEVLESRGFGKWSDSTRSRTTVNGGSIPLDRVTDASISSLCVLSGTVTRPALVRMENFGLINPLSVAWETVPLSFVFDWFIPVGDLLSSLTATAGMTSNGGRATIHSTYLLSLSRLPEGDFAYNETPPRYGRSGQKLMSKGSYREAAFLFNRFAYTNWPRPGFYVNFSPFKSSSRVASAAGLIRNLR